MSSKHLVIGTGGINYFAYLGALQALVDAHAIPHISRVTGASAGALVGFLFIVCGGKDMLQAADVNTEFIPSVTRLVHGGGFYSHDVLREQLRKVTGGNMYTFSSLQESFPNISFDVHAWCVEDMATVIFSAESTPEVLVEDALMASVSVPILFPPVNINGKSYVDCGLLQPAPSDSLFLMCKPEDSAAPESGIVAINTLYSMFLSLCNHTHPKDHPGAICIPGTKNWTKLDMSPQDRISLFFGGYASINIFLANKNNGSTSSTSSQDLEGCVQEPGSGDE